MFPIGERRLKGIDEPERVFELDIEGVEASPQEPLPETTKRRGPKPPRGQRDSEFERRFEDFGQRLSESIQERVLRSLDRTLAKVAPPPPSDGPDDDAIDELADRASEDRIRRRVEDALRASAPPPDSG